MTDKILELTEKIYNEGIVKAKEDADIIILEAQNKAEELLKSAKLKEKEIIEKAQNKALEDKKKYDAEIQLAVRQFTSDLKQKITQIISASLVQDPIAESFNDTEFVKNIILTTIKNWNPQNPDESDLKLLLPVNEQQNFNQFIEAKIFDTLNKGIRVEFDKKTKSGFKIEPIEGNYIISFTKDDFENYFKQYIKEKTREILFDNGNNQNE